VSNNRDDRLMEATLEQRSKDHKISRLYHVLQSFVEPRTWTGGWRYSGVSKDTFDQIVKELRNATYLLETVDGKLIMTESGRNLFTLMTPLVAISGSV